MGLTKNEAKDLAEAYGAIAAEVNTSVTMDAARAQAALDALQASLKLPGVVITAEMRENGGYDANRAQESIDVQPMAMGGSSGASQLAPIAQGGLSGSPTVIQQSVTHKVPR